MAAQAITRALPPGVSLTPGDQDRGWKRRWVEVERELKNLLDPIDGDMSSDSIHSARHRLHAFFVQAYHIKDALIVEAGTTGISKATIEAAVTAEPALALLADLANLDKHGRLDRQPRSGPIPRIVSASGTRDASTGDGWQLGLEIEHDGGRLDGLLVARHGVAAWRRVLTGWGLL